ncbi:MULTISPECIES: hypothetical protein [Chryseobacterium]|uniref:Uncharacterized protein n=1 Tax=Chryseobacterium taihuense TaxID=1141221 RepID=A0A4U8WMS7_9FLAO|nr:MULTISPECIES: hypothetical protein [Chryseobacterium]QQV03066.1 hypothetical protein I6I61_01520 [Chryseobacterium sp. FDAARGOS 1104]VFB03639.1 Uncharacterised protein [Chryseobacterium taihuense]
MNDILKKVFEPKRNLVCFILFALSIIIMFTCLDYTYKKMKTIIILIYFFPGILFFAFGSIYNITRYKNAEIKIKLLVLFPLLIIILYIVYILLMLAYAITYR